MDYGLRIFVWNVQNLNEGEEKLQQQQKIEQWPEGKYIHTVLIIHTRTHTQSSTIWSKGNFQRLLFCCSCRWHLSCLFSHPSLFFGSLFSLFLSVVCCLLVCFARVYLHSKCFACFADFSYTKIMFDLSARMQNNNNTESNKNEHKHWMQNV